MEIVGDITARRRFRRVAGLVMLAAAVTQAVAAVLFFFAANWWSLPPLVKTGAVDAGLLAAALAAALAPPDSFGRKVAATAGAVLTGVLFAIHGQTWQTGADIWELFAAWSAAALGWALVSRAGAAWLLAAGLAVLAIGRWAWSVPRETFDGDWTFHLAALVPLALLGLRAALRLDRGWTDLLLYAAATAFVVAGGLISWYGWDLLAVSATVMAAALAFATPSRFGPWPRAISLAGTTVLFGCAAARLVIDLRGGVLVRGLLMVGFSTLMLVGMAAMARYLIRRVNLPPAAIGLAVGGGVWLAALFAIFGFVNLVVGLHMGNLAATNLLGAILATLLAAWNRGRQGPYAGHANTAFAAAAYGMALAAVALESKEVMAVAVASVPLLAGVAWLARDREGAAFAGFVAGGVMAALWAVELRDAVPLLPPLFAAAGWFALRHDHAGLRGVGLALLWAAFTLTPVRDLFENTHDPFLRGAEILAAAGLYWESARREPTLRDPRLLSAAVALLAGAAFVPAGGAGLVGLAALAGERRDRLSLAAALACGAWSIGRAYWDIDVPLDQKAGLLAIGAVLALAGWIAVAGLPRFAAAAPTRAAALLFLGCAAAPAAAEAISAHANRRVVEQGTEILLPIRPADPRSMVQGDYMALDYLYTLIAHLPAKGGRALLAVGPDRVVTGLRLSNESAGPGVDASPRPPRAAAGARLVLVRGRNRQELAGGALRHGAGGGRAPDRHRPGRRNTGPDPARARVIAEGWI
ncbi:MAG: GDYXXLXY domain-containing protein [Alphaproteobacteria bacterium]|nr:GDYXXLXY domain-containing protein [Alphaproteobacteria bacterium]